MLKSVHDKLGENFEAQTGKLPTLNFSADINLCFVSFASLVADTIIFNSHYNMDTFLNSIQSFLSVVPDYRPKELSERIAPKCTVLYFPVEEHWGVGTKDNQPGTSKGGDELGESEHVGSVDKTLSCVLPVLYSESLHILWPHRW